MEEVETPSEEDWLAMLDAFETQALILDVEGDAGLLRLARSSPAWRLDVEDGRSALFMRAAEARVDEAARRGCG
jgi:hypothetical protein